VIDSMVKYVSRLSWMDRSKAEVDRRSWTKRNIRVIETEGVNDRTGVDRKDGRF
jgi:hypothetical protein